MWKSVFFTASLALIGMGTLVSYFSFVGAVLMTGLGCVGLILNRRAWMTKRHQEEQARMEVMCGEQKDRLLRIISRYRHDWMNDFQILIGNLRLKKYESVEGFVSKVIQRAREESRLSRLDDLELMEYFMEYNSNYSELQLTVDVEDTFRTEATPRFKEGFQYSLKPMIEAYRQYALQGYGEPNHLTLTIGMSDHQISVHFMFKGDMEERAWERTAQQIIAEHHKHPQLHKNLVISWSRLPDASAQPVHNKVMA